MKTWIPLAILSFCFSAACLAGEVSGDPLVSFPGPWAFQIPHSAMILVTDEELEILSSDPDRIIDLSLGTRPRKESLRQVCRAAQEKGHSTLALAFDHFFQQYRPGQHTPRRLMPDMDEYIGHIARIARFAESYGLGLELSLLSPLELGPAFRKRTGQSGVWMHYREGIRDPRSGRFEVQLWQQRRWANNKGAIDIQDAGIRVFAFREKAVPGTFYRVVDPAEIEELKEGIEVEPLDGLAVESPDYRAVRIRIHGRSVARTEGLNRVLAVQQYRTPELDYFSPDTLPFLKELIDRYVAAGIRLNGLYSDEMHIQQNWVYHRQHDHGEFALRYVSPGLAEEFAARYGSDYRDFARYLIYFARGQEDFAPDLSAKQGTMHVFDASPEGVRRTALFRSRYYRFLQDGVVRLFAEAKRHAEAGMGKKLLARYHATWAQSPTIDAWTPGRRNPNRTKYEYTSTFLWSNTVQQAASACFDYFRWGDFLTGGGNDYAEGGWLDRNYYGLAMAASTGSINDIPYAYGAHWGMPEEISRRRWALVNTFGANSKPPYAAVQDMQHREVEVLMLYPLDLTAVDERFGSWMTQYAYANYITADKLLELGKLEHQRIDLRGRKYSTLVALFEPFPGTRLLDFMRKFVEQGGRLIWSGPPPVLTREGEPAAERWQTLFGLDYPPGAEEGEAAPGSLVSFSGVLSRVKPQVILTDFLVDRVYSVAPRAEAVPVAQWNRAVIGTQRLFAGGGQAVFLGFRPRDDQSASLGSDVSFWFDILSALGAYPPSGRFRGSSDNTESVSRSGDYLACRFPNGSLAIARHLRFLEEDWPGGFARDAEADRAYLQKNPPPTEAIRLKDFRVNGHRIHYDGIHAVALRLGPKGELLSFSGRQCSQIVVDGRKTVFADRPLEQIAWAPVAPERRIPGGALMQIYLSGSGAAWIPSAGLPARFELVREGNRPGSRGPVVPCRSEKGLIRIQLTPEISGQWIYLVPK